MKYTPKDIPEGINVTQTHPLKEVSILLGGLVGIVIAIYLILGFVADALVMRMSTKLESKLGSFMSARLNEAKADNEGEKYLQGIIDRLASHVPKARYAYRVQIICHPEINAFAMPGGTISVFEGLLKNVPHENALATVLGHEIAHFEHRDHLRGMGRGLVLLATLTFLGFADGAGWVAQKIVANTGDIMTRKYTQAQETAADMMGAELVYKTYGHAAGVDEFFVALDKERPQSRVTAWFGTHPHAKGRSKALRELMNEKGWDTKSVSVLRRSLLKDVCKRVDKPKKQGD